jgi:hypothetical protein
VVYQAVKEVIRKRVDQKEVSGVFSDMKRLLTPSSPSSL